MTVITRAISDTKTMTKRNLLKSFGSPDTLVENVISPLMTLLIFVFVLGGAMDIGDNTIRFIDYIMPGVIVLCISQCSTATAISTSLDIERGMVDRFRSMPIAKSSVLTGRVVEAVLRTTLTVLLVVAIALLIGFRPVAGLWGLVSAFALLILFSFVINWIAVAFGLFVKGPEGAGAFTMFVQLFTYLSAGFIPTATLPTVLRIFAENQPFTHVINTVRAFLLDTEPGGSTFLAIIWCVGLLVVAFITAMQMYRRKLTN
ncbi:MAG: ABC transporter permease [Suipraeoptans sp.]